MSIHSIRAPNGKTYQIEGPANASQDQIRSQVLKQFPDAAESAQAQPRPQGRGTVDSNLKRFENLQAGDARKAYENARTALSRQITDSVKRKQALSRFDTDPRMQAVRGIAGLAKVSTARGDLQEVARRAGQARSNLITTSAQNQVKARKDARADNFFGGEFLGDLGTSLKAGVLRGGLGIPERLIARAAYHTGNAGNLDYDETLQLVRANTDAELGQSVTGNILGQIIGGGAAGGLVAKGGAKVAGKLASSGSQIARKIGNSFTSATTLQRGQKLRNVAKISGAGAVGGGAQALGEGSDVGTGVLVGAVAAPAIVGAVRGVRNLIGKEPVQNILRRYIRQDDGRIVAGLAAREEAGLPTSIYENLPLQDRQRFSDAIARMSGDSQEQLASTVRRGVNDSVGATAAQVEGITRRATKPIEDNMLQDLATSRNEIWSSFDQNMSKEPYLSSLSPDEAAALSARAERRAADETLVKGASRNPGDAVELRNTEARNYMAPFDDLNAAENVDALIPQTPELRPDNTIYMKESDPEISTMIRNFARSLNRQNAPLTVRNVMDLRSDIARQRYKSNNTTDDLALKDTVEHLDDYLARNVPEAKDAIRMMRAKWHQRGQTETGNIEGGKQRTERQTSTMNERDRNTAYRTSAGSAGRALGQARKIEDDILSDPDSSLAALNQISENPQVQQALGGNLGLSAASDLTRIAELRSESARRLGSLVNEQTSSGVSMPPVRIMQSLLQLSPGTMPQTKIAGLTRLLQGATRIPDRQASGIIDMLFSQNPTSIARAMKFLNSAGPGGQDVLRNITRELQGGIALQGATGGPETSQVQDLGEDTSIYDQPQDLEEEAPVEDLPIDDFPEDIPQGQYSEHLQQLNEDITPEFADLIDRLSHQESSGQQFDANGQPLTSSAGAIGVMQVMPTTAPEAAKMAGVPWDEYAYKNDPDYNKIIGIAYLENMLERYDGNVEKALIAYNAGPGRADQYAAGNPYLPAETQDYVRKIM
jgi:Transglycosylase SLT domain